MRQALRTLFHDKGFTLVAVLTLGLGVGAVTTVFSIVHGVLLAPLAYRDPGQLYAVNEGAPQIAHQYPRLPVNQAHFHRWRESCASCEIGTILQPAGFTLTGLGEPERLNGVAATWEIFPLLGARPQLGRLFTEEDDRPGKPQVAVISDGLWRRRFGASPEIIGRRLQMNGEAFEVIGVLPPEFSLPAGDHLGPFLTLAGPLEVYRPQRIDWSKAESAGNFNFLSIFRLRPGARPERAAAEMAAPLADAARVMKLDLQVHLTPLREQITGNSSRSLWLLLASVGAVLLIVCVNLGNLMLVRAQGRVREAAIRAALGASRGALLKPLLTESLLLAAAGGVLGLFLAYAGVRLTVTGAPVDIPRLDEVRLDAVTLAFALGVSALSGLLCGLWPAWRLTKADPADALRGGASRSVSDGRERLGAREWLIGFEVALSTVLLVAAGLLGTSLLRLLRVERGFDAAHVLSAGLALPGQEYKSAEQRRVFVARVLEALGRIPGVQASGLTSALPLKGETWVNAINRPDDTRPIAERPLANFRFVSSGYFSTLGIPLRQGRLFEETDRTTGQKVVILSRAAVRRTWPEGGEPIGRRLLQDANEKNPVAVTVIGVVDDVRTAGLDREPPPMVYVPYWDGPLWQGNVLPEPFFAIRTATDPATAAGALRAAIHGVDPNLPVSEMTTMEQVVAASTGQRRFELLLAGLFAVSALLLACLGIYGVIAYSVGRRTAEMGVRLALGAQSRDVIGLVLRQGLRPVGLGLAAGVAAALALGRVLAGFLYGTQAADPLVLGGVATAILLVAAAACWVPARRASRIDPLRALRFD